MSTTSESSGTILVVDEEPYRLFLVSKEVQKAFPGANVRSVNSSEAALRFLDEHGQGLAVLVAYEQPFMNGLDLARTLRTRGFAAPIVVTAKETLDLPLEQRVVADRWVESSEVGEALAALRAVINNVDGLLSPLWLA